MGQFVGDQVLPGPGVGGVLAGAENDIAPHRIGVGAHLAGRAFRLATQVYLHIGEGMAEAPLHVCPQTGLQCLAGAGEGALDACRCRLHVPPVVPAMTLDLHR
ncbi:hypothetical protein D9M72_299300 [compost metagenome]